MNDRGCKDSACQYHMPKSRNLINYSINVVQPMGMNFKVYTPDSRLRTKIAVIFVPTAGGDPVLGALGTASLWLAELETDESGVSGTDVPCTNIEGTAAAPTPVPATNGLYGYSREFVTAADAIYGQFKTTGAPGTTGTWILQVRYQPQSVRFTDAEWTELRTRMGVELYSLPQTSGV